jgi:hypothetical protein
MENLYAEMLKQIKELSEERVEINEISGKNMAKELEEIKRKKVRKKYRKNELEDKVINQAKNIEVMETLVRYHKRLITHIQKILEEKNKMLDALHYVWCDGGCGGGVHRYKEMANTPLTEEIVKKAERNSYRLRLWYVNNEFRKRKITLRYYKTFKYRIREILRKLYFALV